MKLDITNDALKFVQNLQHKQYKQIVNKIFDLLKNARPHDSIQLKGSSFYRTDIGEYRIIYSFDVNTVTVVLVGKRNDNEVYRQFDRLQN
jgi:mRNA interferase RelE/StbE